MKQYTAEDLGYKSGEVEVFQSSCLGSVNGRLKDVLYYELRLQLESKGLRIWTPADIMDKRIEFPDPYHPMWSIGCATGWAAQKFVSDERGKEWELEDHKLKEQWEYMSPEDKRWEGNYSSWAYSLNPYPTKDKLLVVPNSVYTKQAAIKYQDLTEDEKDQLNHHSSFPEFSSKVGKNLDIILASNVFDLDDSESKKGSSKKAFGNIDNQLRKIWLYLAGNDENRLKAFAKVAYEISERSEYHPDKALGIAQFGGLCPIELSAARYGNIICGPMMLNVTDHPSYTLVGFRDTIDRKVE